MNQSLREHTFLDHCRIVLPAKSGSHVERGQCICQLSNIDKILFDVDPSGEDLPSELDLPHLRSGIRSNHFQEPCDGFLIAYHPLIRSQILPDVADSCLIRKPGDIVAMELSDANFQADPKTETFFGVLFDQRHDGTVAVNKTRQICPLDFGKWLSHGTNLQVDHVNTWKIEGLHRFEPVYYL